MKIKIAGMSGYLGKRISERLRENGHEVSAINRTSLYGSTEKLASEIETCSVVINLAGTSILTRWTKKNKDLIYNSRILTTENLVNAIQKLKEENCPKKIISASAIGIYKSGIVHDEASKIFDEGFIGKVAHDWEACLDNLPGHVSKCIFRIGLVIGKNSKIIKYQIPFFKLGMGAKIGNGKQPFPFIHEKDLVNAFIRAVDENEWTGIYNLVAPHKVTNGDFTRILAEKLKRPALFSIPVFLIRLVLGKAAVLLTESPGVEPKALLDKGFPFEFGTLHQAIDEIIR